MQITNTLLFMVIRIALLLLIWYYINLKLAKKTKKLNVFDFLVRKGFVYGSLLVFSSFIFLLLGIYEFLNLLLVLSVFGLFALYDFKSPKQIYSLIFKNIKLYLLLNLKRIERGDFFSKTFYVSLASKRKRDVLISITLLILIIGSCFWSRAYFYQYDLYTFSDLWFENIGYLNDVGNQHWLLEGNQSFGSYVFVDFLANITQQIPEVCLYAFGLLESIALCVILYWTVLKIGNTKKTIALITALLFATCYKLLPLNLSFINQNNKILLALLFVVPLLVYVMQPKQLTSNKWDLYSLLFLALFTIASINVFVYIIIVLPLLVLVLLLGTKKQRILSVICLVLYLLVSLVLSLVYNSNGVDVIHFIKSNLIAVSSYTYIPHLLFPLNILLHGVQLVSVMALAVILLFSRLKIENNRGVSITLLFYNFLVLIGFFNLIIVDVDLLIQVYAVFIPLTLGLSLAVITRLLKPIFKKQVYLKRYILPISAFGTFLWLTYSFNKNISQYITLSNQFAPKILSVYNKIADSYLPYSYAVVNDENLQLFSTQKHYYMSFEDFNSYYLKKDKLYQAFREKEEVLKKHPDLVLPKTILLFIYKNNEKVSELGLSTSANTIDVTKQQLALLQQKNREVRLFYENDDFKVIEIINEPNSSKISELMLH